MLRGLPRCKRTLPQRRSAPCKRREKPQRLPMRSISPQSSALQHLSQLSASFWLVIAETNLISATCPQPGGSWVRFCTVRRIEVVEKTITKIYLGQDKVCRCGCRGTYATPSDGKLFTSRLKRYEKMVHDALEHPEKYDINFDSDYTNISYGNDRALCVYFD